MYELKQLTDTCYYIESPARIGLVRLNETDVCLIDSGNDKDAGKKILKLLAANGWRLAMILNTHSNADHIGGNAYLQRQTGCRILAPSVECDFTRHPILEPAFLYGGYPPRDLRHKFLLAEASDAEPLTPEALPAGIEIIPLAGHFFDMVGFRTADGVCYLADCLSSRETLSKYGVTVVYDVGAYLETLGRVRTMEGRFFVPAHAPVSEGNAEIADLAEYNIRKTEEVAERILSFCASPVTFETVLAQVFESYGLRMTFEQYALVGSTVRSYLAYLKDTGRVDVQFSEHRMLWVRV